LHRRAEERSVHASDGECRIVGSLMLLAGIEVEDEAVELLGRLLPEDYYHHGGEKLEHALEGGVEALWLTIAERNAILDVLDDPPFDLVPLRDVLFNEYVWRVQNGLEKRRKVR
jgi:hypothetical protein